jgi:ATP-dependent helicase/nuclease subunit A
MHELQTTLFGVAQSPESTVEEIRTPADLAARRDAVDITRSILVQAPAGAGKTNLLTQRYLALLAQVDEPEYVLALTFTRAATGEMRGRILGALEYARRNPTPVAGESSEMPLARIALAHSVHRGWRILELPHRLDVQTIDSLCMRIAHAQPLLARLGGDLQPSDHTGPLYAEAARRTTALLGSGDAELNQALRSLLLRRDNNLHEVERLLAGMLGRRDAWLGVLPLAPSEHVEWSEVRATLEAPFAAERARVLNRLHTTFAAIGEQTEELLSLARYAAANQNADAEKDDLAALLDVLSLPGNSQKDEQAWLSFSCLLLTASDTWRKQWDKNDGFPKKGTGGGSQEREQWKRRMKELSCTLQSHPRAEQLLQLLCQLRTLPPLGYTEGQWETLLAVFRLLRRAAAELRLVFAETNKVDFIEIAQAAEFVLREEGSLRGMLESDRKQHILIDEFQDTSRAQYRLVSALLREWSEGDGRTLFLVGDPLQSIYGFRQAEVALFHQTRRSGMPCGSVDEDRHHCCHPLTLTHNFRSHQALVSALNERFAPIFKESETEDAASFVAAQAWPQPVIEPSLQFHLQTVDSDTDEPGSDRDLSSSSKDMRSAREAESIVRVLQQELPAVEQAQSRHAQEYRIAILVRSRPHLAAILPALRAAGIPYRAVDLEPLADQPEIIDILSLLRALLHPADRLSWLGVFRAPWCGLLLRDLHMLAGGDDREQLRKPLPEVLDDRIRILSADGHARATRTWAALRVARSTRYAGGNISLAAWLERTWIALGGDACVDATGRDNIDAFLRLLDSIAPNGTDIFRDDFTARLSKLCAAPDARTSDRFGVQVMTIHKAKGLGFDVVLLPGLDRCTRGSSTELLAMLQRSRAGEALTDELLLAPIGEKDSDTDAAYAWVNSQKTQLEREETARLFYVAATRPRTRLHLFATLEAKNGELRKPRNGSLLAAAWPGLEADATARYPEQHDTEQQDRPTAIAASAEGATLADTSEASTYTLERLPIDWKRDHTSPNIPWPTTVTARTPGRAGPAPLFQRAETGSLHARARGTAMHLLMERLAVLFSRNPGSVVTPEWEVNLTRAAERSLRAGGVQGAATAALASALAKIALAVARDSTGHWLLAPHREALAESAWQRWDASGNLRTVRVDRCFRAGNTPGLSGDNCLWIIDYKTGALPETFADENARKMWLSEQQALYSGQLTTYAEFLSAEGNRDKPADIRCGLYFPELLRLVHWPAEGQ